MIKVRWDKHGLGLRQDPGYIKDALVRFKHKLCKLTLQPYWHSLPTYGTTTKYPKPDDISTALGKEGKTFIQQVTVTFLFYARAVDPKMFTALSSITFEQAAPHSRDNEKSPVLL